jgi:sigma-E factor negative regulatory protein RseA
MNERMCESISALMDDEANELELERVLSQIGHDSELRQTWTRYHQVQHMVHGHELAHLDWDISHRVRSALSDSRSSGSQATVESFRQRLIRPLTSLAVAASVTLTVVVGGQKLAQVEGADSFGLERSVATSPSPVGMLNSLGATAVRASYGTQALPALQPATRTAYEELAQQRLRKYMQEHAEQAALNSPQGLVSFARVPQIHE